MGLLKLCVAAAFFIGSIAAYRQLLHPLLESLFSLSPQMSSVVRRVSLLVLMLLAYWAFVRIYERRPVDELSLRPWRWILLAPLAGSLAIGVTILILYATGHYQLVSVRGLGQAGGVLGTIWIAAVLEEVAYRAILFRILEEMFGSRAAMIASAVIFSLSHLGNNGVRWVTVLSVTLAGLMLAEVFVLTRNIWVVAIQHCCWNATIFLIGLPLSGENWRADAALVTTSQGSILWTGGAFGPEDSLVNLSVSLAISAGLWRLAARPKQPM
jgi:membrane protease YdiL (CAAX protease family)